MSGTNVVGASKKGTVKEPPRSALKSQSDASLKIPVDTFFGYIWVRGNSYFESFWVWSLYVG